MDRSKLNLLWILTNICFFIVGIIFIDSSNLYLVLSIIGAIQLIISVVIYIKQGEKLFSPMIVYVIVMYLFLFGQCLMWLITENYDGRNIIDIYSKSDIVKTQIFTLSSFFFFHLACINVKRKENKNNSLSNKKDIMYSAIRIAGIVLLCISIIPEIVYSIRVFMIGYTQGYIGIYENQAVGLFLKFLNLREFFFPAVVLIFVGDFNQSKFKILKKALIIILILDILIGFYVGSRSDALMQCLGLLLLITTLTNKVITKKTYFKYAIILLVLLSITNVVRNIRTESNKDISSFINAFSEKSGNGLIVETMGEMGGSMATCIETMNLVPEYFNYKYGTSYLYSFTWFLPNSLTNNLSAKASMNNWIDTVRYTGSGWGFSTTGEAYFNFGYYGVIIFLIFGIFAGKYFKGLNNDLLKNNPLELALSLILFSRLLIFSRIDFLSTLPSIIYFYVFVKLFVIIIYYFLNRERKNLNDKI